VNRVIHEEANREFREALDYYVAIEPELGVRFYQEMARLMNEVCERPLLFRQFDPPARRHFTDRFPYLLRRSEIPGSPAQYWKLIATACPH